MIRKNLLRRKMRSLLTILGIAFGIAAIVALTAFGAGIANSFGNLFATADADLTLSQANSFDLLISSLDEDIGAQVARMPQVQSVAGIIYSGVRMEKIPFFLVFGYDPQQYAISHYKIVEGRGLQREREIIIGRGASRNLSLKVGQVLQFYDNTFRIVGIYETGADFEEAGGVITLTDAQVIFQRPRQVTLFQVKLRNPNQADEARQRITSRYRDVLVSRGTGANNKQMYDLFQALALGMGLIAAVVGGMGMMNTVMMSVFERTREIGVLRALGWGRRRILGLILGESLVLSLAGGILGIGLGILLVQLGQLNPAISSLYLAEFSPRIFIQAMVLTLVLGIISSAYPAWWATQLQPVEALRYEGGAGEGRAARMKSSKQPWPALTLSPIWRSLAPVWRRLNRRRGRSLLTGAGIGIGVMIVVMLGAITEGFLDQFSTLASGAGADLAMMQAQTADISLSTIDERVGRQIATMPDVAAVSGMTMGFVSTPDVPMMLVFGLEPSEFTIEQFPVVEGRSMQRRGEMIIGRQIANSLRQGPGDLVRIMGRPFRVAGIYETGVGYQDAGAVIDQREAQALFEKPHQVSFYQVRLHDPQKVDLVIHQIEQRFPQVSVSRSAQLFENTEDIAMMRGFITVLSSIAIVVGSVGVMNTLLMSVFERTREIGVLRALGWRRRQILEQILAESLVLAVLGGIAGTLLGVFLVYLMGFIPLWGGMLSGSFKPVIFLQAALVALGLGLIGGVYPAWRATRLQPAEALQYE